MPFYSVRMVENSFGCKFTSMLFIFFSVSGSFKVSSSKWASGLWVKLNILLSSLCSFIFFFSFFHCLMQRCWAANFLKEEYSCSIVHFPISLHNRFSVPLGWHQLQEYVTHFFFFFFFKPHAFSGVFKLARLWNYKNEKDWEFWAASNILFMAYALWKSCTIRFQTVLKYI